jgi:hypothetical protein
MDDNKVAVLIENLLSQFRSFGEGLQQLNDKIDRTITENRREHQQMIERMDRIVGENRQDHLQLKQMVRELKAM